VLNVSIRLRLVLTLLLIIGAGGVTQAVSYGLEQADTASLERESSQLVVLAELGHDLEESIAGEHGALMTYLLTLNSKDLAAYHDARTRRSELDGIAGHLLVDRPTLGEAKAEMDRVTAAWTTGFAEPQIELINLDRTAAARAPSRVAAGEVLFAEVVTADEAFDELVEDLTLTNLERIQAVERSQLLLFLAGLVGAIAGIFLAILLATRWILQPLSRLLETARRVDAGEDVAFRAERDDEIGRLGGALERMRSGLFGQASEASVVNRFTELTAFVEADGDVARATLDALAELVHPRDATIHISNRSKDRAMVEGSIGDVVPGMVPLGQLAHCPGVRRASLFVAADLGAPLAVHCPIHPATAGTLVCIPLQALGEVVGAVHLHWQEPDALPLDVRNAVARITDHASLAIANRRLMTALQGMASTDSRTGLPNSRTFDETLAERLANRNPGDPVSVLMLDIDHFKQFNDRNGHPAGDQALRSFARIMIEAIRDQDMAARYGGEEFVVMLPGASPADAAVVAERIRARTDEAVIDLSPGHRDRITVSIGVATWPADAGDRVTLLETADAALYRAKRSGRNRVVSATDSFTVRAADDADPAPGEPDQGAQADARDPAATEAAHHAEPTRLPRAG
jgi:diguanylate cyclase (GGDEF)-like protein